MSRSSGYAIVIGMAVLSGACASSGATPRPFPTPNMPASTVPAGGTTPAPAAWPSAPPPTATNGGGYEVTGTALGLRGTPYRNGGSDPSGFDCSGFVQWVFAQNGIQLPREVHDQYDAGQKIDLRDVQPGDLLFFETVSRGASHVGVAVGGDQFVHAPSSKGVVRIERFTASYWAMRFVGARRIATEDTKTN